MNGTPIEFGVLILSQEFASCRWICNGPKGKTSEKTAQEKGRVPGGILVTKFREFLVDCIDLWVGPGG